jgi:hypothetical protein
MKRTIGVYLGEAGRRVGTLHFDRQGARQNAAFEYDRTWLSAPDRYALESALPLVAGAQFHKPRGRVLNGDMQVADGSARMRSVAA